MTRGLIPASRNNSRDVPFKVRIRLAYGCDQDAYDNIVDYKKHFESCVLAPPEKVVRTHLKPTELPPIDTSGYVEPQMTPLTTPPSHAEVKFQTKKGDKQGSTHLVPGATEDLGVFGRVGAIANVGGSIVLTRWLPTDSTEYQYVALSVIHTLLDLAISNFQLSMFPKPIDGSVSTSVQVWRYDGNNDLQCLLFIDTLATIGITHNLQWLPTLTPESGVLGVLCGNFTDSKFHTIKISELLLSPEPSQHCYKLKKPSFSVSLPDCAISAYDFHEGSRIIVGTTGGHVGQFILPGDADYDVDECELPLWTILAFKTAIDTIMVADVDENSLVAVINSAGVPALGLELKNHVAGQVYLLAAKTWIKPLYNPQLKTYVIAHASDSISFNFIRAPSESSNTLVRFTSSITALIGLEVVGHPLALAGTAAGEVVVVNYARKFLNGTKVTSKVTVPIRLLKLTYLNDELEVNGDFALLATELPNQLPISPPEVVILTVAWAENVNQSLVYACGTLAGLLIVERLNS